MKILFSSDLVRPEMTVINEPVSTWPPEILAELLEPHGLQSRKGPAGVALVVKAPPPGSISGTVQLSGGVRPIAGAHVVIVEAGAERLTDPTGQFEIAIPEGRYTVQVDLPGFLNQALPEIPVEPGRTTSIVVELSPRPMPHEEVVVKASDPASRHSRPDDPQAIPEDRMLRSPEVVSDPLMTVARLPAATSGDGSGALNVRGGAGDEVKVVLDGLELYEPYHLKDRGGPISILDSHDIGGLGFLGGAFPAEYGGSLSGVIEMDTTAGFENRQTTLALSSADARVASHGRLGESAQWMVSARMGDPSRTLDALGADPGYSPEYNDVFAKISYDLKDRTTLTLNVLHAFDYLDGAKEDLAVTVHEPGTFASTYTNRSVWLGLKHAWSDRIFSQAILSVGRLSSQRSGSNPNIVELFDARETDILGLKTDWLLISGRHSVKWGFDLKSLSATYGYESVTGNPDSITADRTTAFHKGNSIAVAPEGTEVGLYVADRVRVTRSLSTEVGLRWDTRSYVPGDRTTSPRVNIVYSIGPKTAVRAGWGHFYQPHKIHELQVEDGVDTFARSQRAEHRMVGVEHELASGVQLQMTLYQKLMTDLRPRFENLFDPFGLFPEADGDRVQIAPDSARAEGVELTIRASPTRKIGWSAGYTISRAEDEIDGNWVPRSWDQRHSFDVALYLTPWHYWAFTLAGNYHTGRPTTAISVNPSKAGKIVPVVGERNAERLPDYRRVDLRIARAIPLKGSELQTFVNVTNLFDHDNVCCLDSWNVGIVDDQRIAQPQYRNGLPRLVNIGVAWSF